MLFPEWFMKAPFHLINDYENKKILYYHLVHAKLKEKYLKTAEKDPVEIAFGTIEAENPVWVYWRQGIKVAPELVKKCIQSVQENVKQTVIILTEENADEFVSFPNYIIEKMNSGKMSAAAFSDLLRFSLLEHFGGTWIDATVYLTDSLPEYILDSEFFAYQDMFGLIKNPALISNWLLHCKLGNVVMRETRNMAFAYWKEENCVIEYLFTYILLTIALEKHPEIKENMPYANSDYCHLMLNSMAERYNDIKYKHIKQLTSVHKLSYKLQEYVYKDENNFYYRIVGKK